ncbi:MAG: cytidylate kinase-like family protein [Eubacteriales bacterium]|nr:cytidylate kinase-like family protein [Eubacteriales bacterium]
MDKNKLVITIERQYGSGGRIVGQRLAEKLGIPFYDDEILSMTAERSAVGERYFRLADEKAGNNLLRRIVSGIKMGVGPLDEPKTQGDVTSPDNLFLFQSEVIRELAASESCVIVGRCADYVLEAAGKEDLLKVFVYADIPTCIRRTMEVDQITDTKEALAKLNKITKQRREYHKYFTGKDWEDVNNYDLPINASRLDFDQMVDLILRYLNMIGYEL